MANTGERVMSTRALCQRIRRGLSRYYQLKGRYLGKLFDDWCHCLGLSQSQIVAELEKGPQKCRLVMFDPTFPSESQLKPLSRWWRCEVYEVLQRCSEEPNAFAMDIKLKRSTSPINDVFDIVQRDQLLLVDGYMRRLEFNVPIDIQKRCRDFFVIDLRLPGAPGYLVPAATPCTEIAKVIRQIAKHCVRISEPWIAVNLLSVALSAPTLYDRTLPSLRSRLYQQRAFILIEWGEYDAADRDVFDWLALETDLKRAFSGSHSLYKMGRVLTTKHRYEQALRYLRIPISLRWDDTGTQVMCHKQMCLIYEERRMRMKKLHLWDKKQRAIYQQADKHYAAVLRLEPYLDSHPMAYAAFLMRAKKGISPQCIATALMRARNQTELDYKCAFALGRLLAKYRGSEATALEYLLDAQQKGPSQGDGRHTTKFEFQSECMYEIAKTFEKLHRVPSETMKELNRVPQHIIWHQHAIIEAKRWYEQAIHYNPAHDLCLTMHLRLGRLLVNHTHMFDEACRHLLMAIKLMKAKRNGDRDADKYQVREAKQYYKKALKLKAYYAKRPGLHDILKP